MVLACLEACVVAFVLGVGPGCKWWEERVRALLVQEKRRVVSTGRQCELRAMVFFFLNL